MLPSLLQAQQGPSKDGALKVPLMGVQAQASNRPRIDSEVDQGCAVCIAPIITQVRKLFAYFSRSSSGSVCSNLGLSPWIYALKLGQRRMTLAHA